MRGYRFFFFYYNFCFLPYSRVKTELEDLEYAHLPNIDTDEETLNHHEDITNQKPTTRRRGLRSDRSIDSNSNGNSHPEVNNIKAGSR